MLRLKAQGHSWLLSFSPAHLQSILWALPLEYIQNLLTSTHLCCCSQLHTHLSPGFLQQLPTRSPRYIQILNNSQTELFKPLSPIMLFLCSKSPAMASLSTPWKTASPSKALHDLTTYFLSNLLSPFSSLPTLWPQWALCSTDKSGILFVRMPGIPSANAPAAFRSCLAQLSANHPISYCCLPTHPAPALLIHIAAAAAKSLQSWFILPCCNFHFFHNAYHLQTYHINEQIIIRMVYCLSFTYNWSPLVVLEVKNPPANAGDIGFNSWVRKIPWRRAWQPTPEEWAPPTEDPGGLWCIGLQSWTQLSNLACALTCNYVWQPVVSQLMVLGEHKNLCFLHSA